MVFTALISNNDDICIDGFRYIKTDAGYYFPHSNKDDCSENGQKKRATGVNQGPIGMKVKNLQRGTANAVELGGKATVCISCVRYGS
jgi:hypothetical protein